MKKSEIVFSTILVPIDYILLVLAGLSAYFLRYSEIYQENIREVVFSLDLSSYLRYVYLVALVWILIFAMSGLFSMRPTRKVFDLLNKIFLACSTGTLAVLVLFFFSRELFTSRFIILAAWGLTIAYISLAHLTVRYVQRVLYGRGIGVHRMVLVGADKISSELEQEFEKDKKWGYRVVYVSREYSDGLRDKIKELADADKVDEIVQVDPNLSREDSLKLIDTANEYHLDFKYVADLLGARRSNFDIKTVNGIPIVEIKKTPLDGWGRVVKRGVDVLGSTLALIVCIPLFIIIPILIRIDSKGRVVYKTERVGSKGKRFYLYKFRSMVEGADKMKQDLAGKNERPDGPLFKMKDDPRITKVGKFLRRTSLDEFPNFWNVLIGNMSLVGPRPHEPGEVDRYKKHHRKLLDIKPGITGMAQVSGRSSLDFESEVKLDTLYIESWSLKQDFIILVKTPWVVLFSKTAV